MINIIHLHILATTIVHISQCYKGDRRRAVTYYQVHDIINEEANDRKGTLTYYQVHDIINEEANDRKGTSTKMK